MQEQYLAAVDFGTANTSLAVARQGEDGCASVVYFGKRPSEGIRHGQITNQKQASKVLESLLKEAEEELSIRITNIAFALPRFNIRQTCVNQRLERTDPDSFISEEELDSLRDMASHNESLDVTDSEDIYAVIPQSFSTEDLFMVNANDVVGSTGRFIEGQYRIIIGQAKAFDNFEHVLRTLDVSIDSGVFLPAFEGNCILSQEEMENGTALVEMGAGVTSISIYHNGALKYFDSIPFGGATISSDIKKEGSMLFNLADNIKKAYGYCHTDTMSSLAEKVLQINDDSIGTSTRIPVKYLSEIVTARQTEIMDAVLYHIQLSGFADRLRGGIVLIGGAAQMGGLGPMLRDMSGYNIRLGHASSDRISDTAWPVLGRIDCCSLYALLNYATPYSMPATTEPAAPIHLEEEPVRDKLFTDVEMGTMTEKEAAEKGIDPKTGKKTGRKRILGMAIMKKLYRKSGETDENDKLDL